MASRCGCCLFGASRWQSRSPGIVLATGALLLPLMGISECASVDGDADGYDTSTDCDDADPSTYPGAPELCDGRDQDCDRLVDEELDMGPWQPDLDGDLFGDVAAPLRACSPPAGWTAAGGDCDDQNPEIYPGAVDAAVDGLDADCGGFDASDPSVGLFSSQFQSIQDALNAAKDDPAQTIWVGPGAWFGAELSFGGKALHLRSTHGQALTTIDADWIGSVMIFDQDEGPDSVLEGFTLSGGFANLYCPSWGCGYYGGGILIMSASPTLKSLTVRDSRATWGAGIFAYDSSLMAQYLWVLQNEADGYGGGGQIESGGTVRIRDSIFSHNTAEQSSGGLSINASDGILERLLIIENSAVYGSAGIRLGGEGSSIYLSDSIIASNTASVGPGGGAVIDQSNGANNTLHRVWVSSNTSAAEGGGLYLQGGAETMHLSFVELDHNTSFSDGGGIAASGGSFELSYLRMTGNHADQTGGAIRLKNGTLHASHSVFAGNTAQEGGGILLEESTVDLDDSIVAYNEGGNFDRYSESSGLSIVTLGASCVYNPPTSGSGNQPVSGEYSTEEPGFLAYADASGNACTPGSGPTCLPEDLHLSLESGLVDIGSGGSYDVDGSPVDVGIYGGTEGASWDRDHDGLPDWFWPGACYNAPVGFSSSDFDAADADPARTRCQEEGF